MRGQATAVWYDGITVKGLGEVWFAISPRGLWRVGIDTSQLKFVEGLYEGGAAPEPDKRATANVRRQLTGYFAGKTHRFKVPIDWDQVDGFTRKTLQICARIPYGRVLSYAGIARRLGNPMASRAVGNAMGKNPFPIVVPCHRVIKSDGSLGGYGGGEQYKRFLLRQEGIDPERSMKRSMLP